MSESAEESQRSGTSRNGTEKLDRMKQVDRRVGSVDRRLASTVKKMARDLQDLASAAEEEAVGQLLAATARVDGETTQSGILTALLEEGRRFASRTAFFWSLNVSAAKHALSTSLSVAPVATIR